MCVPTVLARSRRRAEQAEPAAGLEGDRAALVLSMVWDLWAVEASWLLTASPSASNLHPCVLQSWALRQPSEGSTKMLTVPPDPGCYFLSPLRVSCNTKIALILPTFLRHFLFLSFSAEREIPGLSKCCSSMPQVCGWERNWTKHKANKRGKMYLLWQWTFPSLSGFCRFPGWDAKACPSLKRAVQ